MKRRIRSLAFIIIAVTCLIVPTMDNAGAAGLPIITHTSTAYDQSPMLLSVFGSNFGTNQPTVKLGDITLIVRNWDQQNIVAYLPDGIASGSYLLTVTVPTRLIPLIAALALPSAVMVNQDQKDPKDLRGFQDLKDQKDQWV